MNLADKVSQLAEIAREIRADPLARIMYGSRELFHSNLLAWLCELYPDEIGPVFDQLIEHGGTSQQLKSLNVQREWRHLDLVLSWSNRSPLVIENKVFSLPRNDQLDAYAKQIRQVKALGPETRAVLLSLCEPVRPTYTSSGKPAVDWHYVSYGDLAGRLAEQLPSGKSYELETARRYVRLSQRLQELANLLKVDNESEPVFISSWASEADDKQLMMSASKLRAFYLSNYIDTAIEETKVTRTSNAGLTNATPMIEFAYDIRADGKDMRVGWQLQGHQFRLFAVLPQLKGLTPGLVERRNQWGLDHPEYFQFDTLAPITGTSRDQVVPQHKFNRFNPDFIYRYLKLPELTVGQLAALALQYQSDLITNDSLD
ncbi:PD-(D/E)XK nuclease family protein [Gordonia polyisoprenivorans]|uniref:PD-(D/E)XK nuclease family protein n=1 Tax=Gordonia polyisoprenivorans TaxID=84595 RepID=UPI002300DD2A|nr:PD-(D/E)XK nuclease family protein [Gordonia polyisoprenivorans]WCB37674.1 PD-(D/E)XK nuclease family protein [Gordonia polyisoprenivorans]